MNLYLGSVVLVTGLMAQPPRVTGDDIPLAGFNFDGNTLTLEMSTTISNAMPATLTMTSKGDKFEGHWMRGTTQFGPALKLVRFR
jgi:hypothetical protein